MLARRLTTSARNCLQRAGSREFSKKIVPSFGQPHPVLQLQRTLGNRKVTELIQAKRLTPQGKIAYELTHVIQKTGDALLQTTPNDSGSAKTLPSRVSEPDPIDEMLRGMQIAEGVLDLSLKEIAGEPLTSAEMYELLLIRRAEPLSIPASVVNEAHERISDTNGAIAAADQAIRKAGAEIEQIQQQSKRLRGSGKEVAMTCPLFLIH